MPPGHNGFVRVPCLQSVRRATAEMPDSGVGRPRSLSLVIGMTCGRHTVGLDFPYATLCRHSLRVPGDLLDCSAVVGMHDP